MAKKTADAPSKRVVQNGKVIPPEIINLMSELTKASQPDDDGEKSGFSASLDIPLSDLLEMQDAVADGDLQRKLRDVAVAVVELIGEINDDPDISFKEIIKQLGDLLLKWMEPAHAVMSTLVIHRFAEWIGTEIPRDLRLLDDGTLYSSEFEDAD